MLLTDALLQQRLSFNQQHTQIIYIRAGGPCHNQATGFFERRVSVVLFQHAEYIQPFSLKLIFCVSISIAACRVGRTVGAIAAQREYGGAFQAADACRGG